MSKIKLTLGQQQRLNDLTLPALVAAFLASPFYFALFATGYVYVKHTNRTLAAKVPTYLGAAACAFFFILLYGSFGIRCRCAFPQQYQTGYLCQNRLLLGWIALPCACTPLLGLPHQIKCCWSDPNRSDKRGKSILMTSPLSTARTLLCWVLPDPENHGTDALCCPCYGA